MLISVIIPCFNSGKTLLKAVLSVKNQVYQPIEIIVVNDGSNEKYTLDVLNSLENITLHNQGNRGLPSARNAGINISNGELLFFLDADDYLDPNALMIMFDSLRISMADYVYPLLNLVGEKKGIYGNEYSFFTQLFFNRIPYAILIPKKTILSVGKYDESMVDGYEDWELNIRLGSNLKFPILCSKAIMYYNVSSSGMLISKTQKKHGFVYSFIVNKHKKLYSFKFLINILRNSKRKCCQLVLSCLSFYALSRILSTRLFSKLYVILRKFY